MSAVCMMTWLMSLGMLLPQVLMSSVNNPLLLLGTVRLLIH